MTEQVNHNLIGDTDVEIFVADNVTITLRTDLPWVMLRESEREDFLTKAMELHTSFIKCLEKEISLDNYIQIGSDDTLVIANEAERFAIIYPNGKFAKHSPLFYLDWAPEGTLIEVLKVDSHMASFVYKK